MLTPDVPPLTEVTVKTESLTLPEEKKTEETVKTAKPTEIPDKNVLSAVLQICRKYNLKVNIRIALVKYQLRML